MRYFLSMLLMIITLISCSDNNRDNVLVNDFNINGTWKPLKYEYKGKIYPISTCQQKGQLLINKDFSGVYERYGYDDSSSNCLALDSHTGKWDYDQMYNTLTLKYSEAGTSKTIKKSIDSYSDTELRILDNTKNLSDLSGND